MKQSFGFVVGMLWIMNNIGAQVVQYDPGKVVVVTGTVADAGNLHGVITFTNVQATDSLHAAWKVIENTFNPAWDVVFCTDICYTQVKYAGQYAPLAPNKSGIISVDVTPNGAADTGWLKIWLYDPQQGSFSDTVTVEMRIGTQATSIGKVDVREMMMFRQMGRVLYFGEGHRDLQVKVYSLTGEVVGTYRVRGQTVTLRSIPAGIYFVWVADGQVRPFVRRIYLD